MSHPPIKELDPGMILAGRYEIVRRIPGGMDAVYLAKDRTVGDVSRAVREIVAAPLDPAQQEKAIEDFNRESALLASLEHPSIPTLFDYFYDQTLGRFYQVTQFISGNDLALRLHTAPGGRVDEKTVADWATQIADVLEYLHSQPEPIILRDLKPDNLMIDDKSGRVMLTEVGIARSVRQEKGVTAVGTMGYAPPELYAGKVEPRSDVYSLGATMFHLLTGCNPQDNPLLIFDFHKNPRPRQIEPSISSEMEQVLMQAVEYKPEDRFHSAGEMRDALAIHLEKLMAGRVSYGTDLMQRSASSAHVEMPMRELGPMPQENPVHSVEDIQFTVYRPKRINTEKWYTLLAYAHLSERPPDDESDLDPIEQMEQEVERILGEDLERYRRTTEDSLVTVPRQGEISFVPFMPGVEFNPPYRSFLWQENVHRQEFRMRASVGLAGKIARGRMSVFWGAILLAEINLSIQIDSAHAVDVRQTPYQSEKSSWPYRNIFPSYSHQDREIVAQIEHYAQIAGDKYMRDVYELRSGQNWKKWMKEAIHEADIFQLFWSTNSMRSQNVRLEWQYALQLRRPHFIRPTYWEHPMPQSRAENLPPPELIDLHFQHVRPPSSMVISESGAKDVFTAAQPPMSRQPAQPPTSWQQLPMSSQPAYAAVQDNNLPQTLPRRGNRLWLPVAASFVLFVGMFGVIGTYLLRSSSNVATNSNTRVDPVSLNADLVEIPAGTFRMGLNDGLIQERPEHAVTVARFYMDRTEVTNEEYAEFVRQTGYQTPSDWINGEPPPRQEYWPVVNVSVRDAEAFAAWRTKRDGITYRLPTEEEWEYASRSGGVYKLFPWGDRWEENRAVVKAATASPVGSYPEGKNRWGVLDLIGNVWEWTSSKASFYSGNTEHVSAAKKDWVVARGGSYVSDPNNEQTPISATYRGWFESNNRRSTLGFRLVRSAE